MGNQPSVTAFVTHDGFPLLDNPPESTLLIGQDNTRAVGLQGGALSLGDVKKAILKTLDFTPTGTLDPATDQSVAFKTALEAAMADPRALTDEGLDIVLPPGMINLSGLSTRIYQPDNTNIRIYGLNTSLVTGAFVGGTSTYSINPRVFMETGKNCILEIDGVTNIGGGWFVESLTGVYGDAADWGAVHRRIKLTNNRGVKCHNGLFRAEHDSQIQTEQDERYAVMNVATNVVGNGSANTFVTSAAFPARTDTAASKVVVGDKWAAEASMANGRIRSIELEVVGADSGTQTVTFLPALPAGVTLMGPVSATATASTAAAGELKITVDNTTNMFKGRHVIIGGNTTEITEIDGLTVYLATAAITISGVTTITSPGSQLVRQFTPAVTYKEIIAQDNDYEVITKDDTGARFMYVGNTSFVALEKVDVLRNKFRGGVKWGLNIGSTWPQVYKFSKALTIADNQFIGFMPVQGTSGGCIQTQGFQTATRTNNKYIGIRPRLYFEFTLAADTISGKNFIQVSENLAALLPDWGFTINGTTGEKNTYSFPETDVIDGSSTTANGGAAQGASTITTAGSATFSAGQIVNIPITPSGGSLVTRPYAVTSHSGTTLTLKDPLEGAVANGATLTRRYPDVGSTQAQSRSTGAAAWRMFLPIATGLEGATNSPTYITAVEKDGATGTHKLWFEGSGHSLVSEAGTKVIVGGLDMMNTDGQELYTKDHNCIVTGDTVQDCVFGFQGTFAFKGGASGQGDAHNTTFSIRGSLKNSYYECFNRQSHSDPIERVGAYIQASNITVSGNIFRDYSTGAIQTHNLTVMDDLVLTENRIENFYFDDGVRLDCFGGGNWNVDENHLTVHPLHKIEYNKGYHSAIGFYYSNSSAGTAIQTRRASFTGLTARFGSLDTSALRNNTVQNLFHSQTYHGIFNLTQATLSTNIIEGFQVGGRLITDTYSFLMLGGANTAFNVKGRIGNIRITADTDLKQCYTEIQDVVCQRSNFNGVPNNIMMETTLSAGASAGDKTISIPVELSRNLKKGMVVYVELDSTLETRTANFGASGTNSVSLSAPGGTDFVKRGALLKTTNGALIVHDRTNVNNRNWRFHRNLSAAISSSSVTVKAVHQTWLAKDSDFTGVLHLRDPIPSTATSANVVFIGTIGAIVLDDPKVLETPKCLGYQSSHKITAASGATSVVLDLDNIWPAFRHSPWAPLPEHITIRPISGDMSVDFSAPAIVDNILQTKLTAGGTSSSTSITVEDITGFEIGDQIEFSTSDYGVHPCRITGITPGTGVTGDFEFSPPIRSGVTAANNNTVTTYGKGGSVTWTFSSLSADTVFAVEIRADEILMLI